MTGTPQTARNISQIFAASPTSTNARQDSVSYNASAERKQPALATTKEAKNWPSSCFGLFTWQIVNVQKEANASHLFKSQGFRFFRFLHPLRFLCWRFPRPLHHGNKIWKRAGDINGRGLDLLAPQWDEMPKQTHVYSVWHPSLCVIQSQTWGTPYPYMLSTKCFVGSCWFHIPSHDVQTCPNNSKFKSDSALLQDTVNHGDLLGHHSKPVTRRCQGLIGSRKWMEMAIARAHANSFANFVLLEIWINHSCELLWSPHWSKMPVDRQQRVSPVYNSPRL